MPTRDRGIEIDGPPLEKIEDRLTAIEEVIAAQARSTRDLTSRIEEFQSAIKVVQIIQDDFQTQRATRAAWAQVMKTVQWFVVVAAAAVGAIAAYIGMHASK